MSANLSKIQEAARRFSGEKLARIAEQWATGNSIKLWGDAADSSEFDDSGEEDYLVMAGPHRGHIVNVRTAKHNCGAYDYNEKCSCGAWYQAPMNGCWQSSHQCDEDGEKIL